MNQDILLSKIVPNTTDTTWSQAYTTLNVYMTLSIENETSKIPITSYGKELLEKLQREFFALDDKSLEHIKKAVSNVVKTIEPEYKYSILIGAIVSDILYIVIASVGTVIVKRDGKAGTIATGEENEIIGFSGRLSHDDIVVFETGDFAKKMPIATLQEYLSSSDVSQIAENITPLVHDESKGTEAAIILQFKDISKKQNILTDETLQESEEVEENKEPLQNEKLDGTEIHENLWEKPINENRGIEELDEEVLKEDEKMYKEEKKRPSFKFPQFNFANKRISIAIVILILIGGLIGGIMYQQAQKASKQRDAQFQKIFSPSQSKFEEGMSLASTNKSEAIITLNDALKLVNDSLSTFPKNSNEYKKLTDLKSQIENKISEIGGGSSAENIKEVLKAGSELSSIDSVTLKGKDIVIGSSNSKKAAIITDGKIKKTFDTKGSIEFISSDDKFIYTLGDVGITKIDRENGKSEVIVKDARGSAIDAFGGNVYTLESNDVNKYRSPSYLAASYFASTPEFTNTPVDMSISGPVYILETGGIIERFTKGKKDDFTLKGLTAPFADNARLYTDGDFENVYVMDVKNQRVVVLNNKGEYQNQYEGKFIKDAKSFAIDEKNKIGYVVSNNTLFSFDL